MGWTKEQNEAIMGDTGAGNILVSAAAGSGKTAVLVERVLRKIITGATSVDRLLVVTFTEAAAAEMREKIIKSISDEIENGDRSREELRMLKNQVRLAESADIMTIDAFCGRVVRNNFHVLGTDPNAAVIDSAMMEMLRAEAVGNVFDSLYRTDDPEEQARFSRLIEAYASDRNDDGLEKLIYSVYGFISSFAEPEKWLDEAAEVYRRSVEEMPHVKYLMGMSRKAAKGCAEAVREFLNGGVSDNAAEFAKELLDIADDIIAAEAWDDIYDVYKSRLKKSGKRNAVPPITERDPDGDMTEGERERLIYIRDTFKSQTGDGIVVPFSEIEAQCDPERLAEESEDIVWIVKRFMAEFRRIKDARALCEFSDIEHLAYELFSEHEDIRAEYRDKYDEILIDEYQDTNGLQDSIFRLISKNNMFMVGDLKQSIYRFRGGDPYIFKEKSESYEGENTDDLKITLSQNFRSRMEILAGVNDIFGCIMSDEAGDVKYSGSERIVREKERDYYPAEGSGASSELHCIAVRPNAQTDKSDEEIKFTVQKIKELLLSGMPVYDKDIEGCRPIRKKDIVILENSVKGNGEEIVRRLSECGIDGYVENEMFFDRREIKIMTALLSVINNEQQDVPLISVMRSPIGGFTDDELARIRLCSRGAKSFSAALSAYASRGNKLIHGRYIYRGGDLRGGASAITLRYKCRKFRGDLRRWRSYVRDRSVASLIWSLYEETYFYDMMGAIDQGEEAQLNLRLLYERAKQYENAGFKGLFNFIRYIGSLEGRDKDISGAVPVGENHDVVRVMTIHKSKGLEFPVVFLIGAGKQFNNRKDSGVIEMHKDLMFGLPYIHYDEHYMRENAVQNLVKKVNQRELESERMRLLYVALTRARERLFVVVSRNVKEDATERDLIKKWESSLVGGRMLPSKAISAKGFYDWICPAAYSSKNTWSVSFHFPDADAENEEAGEEELQTYENKEDVEQAVYEILDYSYPYPESSTVPSRTSVTQLKELSIERGEGEIYEPDSRRESGSGDIAELMFSPLHAMPAFMRGSSEKPANEIGTLYHLVMSEIDMELIKTKGADHVVDELRRLVESGKISEEDMKYIDRQKIERFMESDICARMMRAVRLRREAPFQISIPASEYDPSLGAGSGRDEIILQGIIDCFFEEPDGYVLLDYKTDKLGKGGAAEIRARYDKQLELYARAIEKLTGGKVKEKLLYLFDSGETV